MGLLTKLDEEITKEALLALGFHERLNTNSLSERYNLESMSNSEKADMVNENIYYQINITNYYHIQICYFPSSYYCKLYDIRHSDLYNHNNLHRNTNINEFSNREYNLTIESKGVPYNPACGQKVYVDNLRELEDWLGMAKIFSEKEPKHIDWED